MTELLRPLDVAPVLVTGSMRAKARTAAAAQLESREPLIAVGTHALVQQDTTFGGIHAHAGN